MKIVLLVLIFFLPCLSFAQTNLVPNPSFEDTISCPTYYNQVNNANEWSSFRNSPDYFHSCNTTFVGIPLNDEGFQYARTGNAYSGFITYAKFGINAREFIGGQLISPTIIGETYNVSFFISLAYGSTQHTNIATNKIGIQFFTREYSANDPAPLNNFAQIYSNSVVNDSLLWTNIDGTFIADSNYSYFAIGNFFSDSLTDYIQYDSSAAFAYYYLDDISMYKDSMINMISSNYQDEPIKIFPVPAHNEISIQCNDLTSISISDLFGKKLFEEETGNINTYRLNVAYLKAGSYALKIKNKKIVFYKIIILTH